MSGSLFLRHSVFAENSTQNVVVVLCCTEGNHKEQDIYRLGVFDVHSLEIGYETEYMVIR